ncbi:MAG: type I-U CRISPR-associated protein Csx17, partial [Myxococcales bacterium]|nr:type I-U CRISPR-associated protein Csx17 [Myxococcales bacterium]
MTTLLLAGCQATPLASYLKALGLLRLIAEQRDAGARGRWTPAGFELDSVLDEADLVRFVVEEYVPTPIVAPWNGGSGFFPKDSQAGIGVIEASDDPRFASYREVIAACRAAVADAGLDASPKDVQKAEFLARLRGGLPEVALAWMDAAVVLGDGRPEFPPLLGTGGNDGRLDFTNNQMQRLAALLLGQDPKTRGLTRSALFAESSPGLERAAIGQFAPAAAGGANAGPGFDRDSLVNPWDYVLMLEGALLFAAAATRREEIGRPGTMSFPFCVRASAAGYGTAAATDPGATRNEMWLPLWERF